MDALFQAAGIAFVIVLVLQILPGCVGGCDVAELRQRSLRKGR